MLRKHCDAKDVCFLVSLIQMRWMDEWASVFLRPQVSTIIEEEHETFEDARYGRLSSAHKGVISGTLNRQFCHN